MTEPFEHRDVGADTTLFIRQTEGGGREGFVVDEQRLVETLKERVLDERGLAEVVDVAAVSESSSLFSEGPAGDVGFVHQFAEPFAGVRAELQLAPLEPPPTEQLLLPMTLGLAMLIVLGLAALYRMVAVRVEFATRQANFVSAVTHELKTPLTAIRMHGEMLRDGLVEDDEHIQRYYETITAQAERLSRLIGNVLLLSNIEKAPAPPAAAGPLRELVQSTIEALAPHAREQGFRLDTAFPDSVPDVHRDADAVEQIVFNLVDNALKYAKEAEDRRISVALEVGAERVLLVVRDRGPGIPPEQLSKVFEPFYRGEHELTRKHQGTGLGLALVRDLAQRMGARVTAENEQPGLRVVVGFRRARAAG